MSDADPYLPNHGDLSYRVTDYRLDLTYTPAGNRLQGQATLSIRIEQDTRRLVLDLHHLSVRSVTVSGATLRRHTHRQGRLALALDAEAAVGTELTVVVRYQGSPRPIRSRSLGRPGGRNSPTAPSSPLNRTERRPGSPATTAVRTKPHTRRS